MHGCFDYVEEAEEGVGKGLYEICDTTCAGDGEVFPDYSDLFGADAGFLLCLGRVSCDERKDEAGLYDDFASSGQG